MDGIPKFPDNQFKAFVYEQFSRLGKALSSPHRLIILNILCQGEHTVEALAKYSGLNLANVSQHLQILKSSNLVKVRRSGKHLYYIIADEQTAAFFTSFKDFAYQRFAEIQMSLNEISKSPTRLKPVDMDELKRKVSEEEALIIDVRPEEEFIHAHLPGAISIPLTELEKKLYELPWDKSIVAYCRGRFCILADQAVEILISKGFDARRANDGVIEWKMAGFPVEES
jgi:rhodanese-related sulfurtransferase